MKKCHSFVGIKIFSKFLQCKRIVLIILSITAFVSSCSLVNRIFLSNKISSFKGHSSYCRVYSSADSSTINYFLEFTNKQFICNGDSVLSIGAGSGGREFLISLFTDNILFYLEDLDTSCITKKRIDSIYLPHYSSLREKSITNNFITISGTDTTVFLKDNSVNKVFIYNVYHHFLNDIAVIKDCKRVLIEGGKLIIGEHVLNRNRKSFMFCDYGGYYKTEENFVKDIENSGFVCDTVIAEGKYWRLFIFSKN
jgi:SAM-dependent methyltransferase